MRDLAVTAVIFGLLPFVLARPDWGILLWTWVGLMNPHRLAWGFAYSFPFAVVIGAVTIIAIFISREPKRLPMHPVVLTLIAFFVWMTITTFFALFPSSAWPQLEKVAKIQLFILLTLVVMQSRERIKALVWVSALSIAFYGIKGGVYTIAKGGHGMVLGPDGGFVAGNTEIALALTMTLPLMRWLQTQTASRWLRWALGVSMVLIVIAILGSYSRGGFLALAAMGVFFWLKGNKKILIGAVLVMLIPLSLALMPEEWHGRMDSIQHYEQDTSAMARLNSWGFAWNLAKAKPFTGGGFQTFQPDAFAIWAPDPTRVWDAHSIWMEIMAEHGFVGLALYLMLWLLAWLLASNIISRTRSRADFRWAGSLAAMIQASLIGYWIGGAFLSLAYWDYPYILVALLVLTKVVVDRELVGKPASVGSPISAPAPTYARSAPQLEKPG